MTVQPELGAKYKTRHGLTVVVIDHDADDDFFPWRGDNGQWYTNHGKIYSSDAFRSEYDLIERLT